MADGNLVHESSPRKGAMVFGPDVYNVPLLPYERELIKTIGITEEEYQLFAAEVRRRGRLRPAEYEHIPEINNEVTTVLVSLAISLVLTGVSYLLTPKPSMPKAPKRGGAIDTGSLTGPTRFSPSRGFETLNELADYASSVPIIFGLYQSAGSNKGGGIFVTPKLVWSRMFSYGTQQSALLLFVVGEQGLEVGPHDGIHKPELEGIFLGNNALDPLHEDQFAFYWLHATTTPAGPRIKQSNLQYGTQGSADSGNPAVIADDIFVCLTNQNDTDTAFCHAYSPANSTEFGAYSPIANGNGIKVNYEVIPIGQRGNKDGPETKKSVSGKVMRRVKIVGDENQIRDTGKSYGGRVLRDIVQDQNQEGTGRQYSPRMGIISVRQGSSTKTTASGDYTRQVRVNVGDIAKFLISDTKIDEDVYRIDAAAVSVAEINSLVFEAQVAADEQMQKGELFAIAGTVWKVIDREKDEPFMEGEGDQEIDLECIDTSLSADKTIGIVDRGDVVRPPLYIDDKQGVGPQYYPLTRISVASIRNNRPAVVTELGIKSTVFQRLNGLAAINGLPTPSEIKEYGKENVTVTTGTITSTIPRASVFRIALRKADTNDNFEFLKEYFVVIGSKPIAQYNYVQIMSPIERELEFKIVPVPAAELRTLSDGQDFVQLLASAGGKPVYSDDSRIPGISGNFVVRCGGRKVEKSFISHNQELIRQGRVIVTPGTAGVASQVGIKTYLPEPPPTPEFAAQKIEKLDFVSTPDAGVGRNGAFTFALAGDPDIDGPNTKTTETTEYYNNNTEFIKLRWQWVKRVIANPDQYARKFNGQNKAWDLVSCTVINSSKGFPLNHEFEVRRGLNRTNTVDSNGNLRPTNVDYLDRNPFKRNNPDISDGILRGSGIRFKVTETRTIPQQDTGQVYLFEKFGSARNYNLGTERSVVITETEASKTIAFTLKVMVDRIPNNASGETIGYSVIGIEVRKSATDEGWQIGDTFEGRVTASPQNPYANKGTVVGARFEVTEVASTPTESKYEGEKFEFFSQYNDISFYRNLIQKSNETEPEHQVMYVNEIVPNSETPKYTSLVTAGLSLKASRAFTSLDQMRCWLKSGLKVKRLHPKYNNSQDNPYESDSSSSTFAQRYGPSHLFTDLVFYMLTDQMAGAGALLNMTESYAPLVDVKSLEDTSVFLDKQGLFYNGAITERTNIREFITDLAPYFLCNFIVTDGKFGLIPALPFNAGTGRIVTQSVTISQLFTSGNILDNSFSLEYLRSEERRPFVAVVRYRGENPNKFPEEKSVIVFKEGSRAASGVDKLPHEQFDLTAFCTSEEHATKVARYFLALRELVTHTIKFSTTVFGLNLKAGSFIKVITESSPYSSANNGTVDSSGNVVSVSPLEDGQYKVLYYRSDGELDVQEGTMQISGSKVAESKFHNSVFTIDAKTESKNIYVVEQLTFSEEGTVDIVASEHPCVTQGDIDDVSKLALAVIDDGGLYKVIAA